MSNLTKDIEYTEFRISLIKEELAKTKARKAEMQIELRNAEKRLKLMKATAV